MKGTAPAVPTPDTSDKRIVAYIHGNIPLTREEYGEHLIQRLGAERIELFVNKKIIERACAAKGISEEEEIKIGRDLAIALAT